MTSAFLNRIVGEIKINIIENQKKYANSKWWRSAVSLIPYVGGSLDIIFSYEIQKTSQNRIEILLDSLSKHLNEIEETMINKDILESEEWIDLVRLAVEKTTRIRNEERINAIAKILKEIVVNNINSVSHAEDIIDVISELRKEETIVLGLIYKEFINGKNYIEEYGEALKPKVSDEISGRVVFIVKRLDGLGLLIEQTGAFPGLNYSGGKYKLSNTGKEICKYLINKNRT